MSKGHNPHLSPRQEAKAEQKYEEARARKSRKREMIEAALGMKPSAKQNPVKYGDKQ
jgi:hypothetical protein